MKRIKEEKTRNAVRRIASNMIMVNKEPTIRTVRAEMGYGSASTIGPALREWRMEIFAKTQNHEKLSPTFPERLTNTVLDFWQLALEEAEKRFAEERSNLVRMRDDAISQRNDLDERCSMLEQKLEIYMSMLNNSTETPILGD